MAGLILETRGLKKYYRKQPVVNNVSLRVPRNSIYGLLGPNGAGKSTILKMVTGLIRPDEGEIIVFGEPWSRRHLKRIGALIESPAFYGNLTVHLWIAKIAVMGVHTLISTLVLIVSTVLSGIIAGGGKIPWSQIFAAAFTVWVVSLAIIPLQLWMATWKGTLGSMVMGFTGMITGVLAASEPYWIYVPWSWPTRLMSPIIGVHPNGTLLEPDSPLLDASVIPVGIIVSLITLLIFTCLTAIWFDRREVG